MLSKHELQERLSAYGRAQDLQLVILFGSRAHGTNKTDSDIDIALLGAKEIDLLPHTNNLMSALGESRVDIVDLRRCDPLIGMRALQEGKVLHRTPGSLGAIGSYISRRYADTAKFRKASDRRIDLFLEKES
jgi:predicted nucleotidyltransferase